MSNVTRIGWNLTRARIKSSRANASLDVMAIAAFTVASFLALTVAGGTWMFINRHYHPTPTIAENLELRIPYYAQFDPNGLTLTYVLLAIIACAIVVVPILSLGGGAARLGAQGRAQRLASLRLIGMTGGEVIRISLLETLLQAALGTVVGLGLWFASLPLWERVTFQGQKISDSELILAPQWILLLCAVLLVLAVLSTALGLRRVSISPLGVAQRHAPKRLTWFRAVAFVAAVIAFYIFAQGFDVLKQQMLVFLAFGGILMLVIGAINLIGPLVLQVLARIPLAVTSNPQTLVAMRRIVSDPKAAWRNVGGLGFMVFLASFVAVMPDISDNTDVIYIFTVDIRTGTYIVLAVGIVVATLSNLINQASTVVDRAHESVALDRIGVPFRYFTAIRLMHVLVPLVITIAISVAMGYFLGMPLNAVTEYTGTGLKNLYVLIACAVLAAIFTALILSPLQRRVLAGTGRRND